MSDLAHIIRDFAERTIRNFDLIEALARVTKKDKDAAAFEVTQLVNSLYGIIIFTKEVAEDEIDKIPLADLQQQGWPQFDQSKSRDQCQNLRELIVNLRHSFAHGRFRYNTMNNEIIQIQITNKYKTKKADVEWCATIGVEEMKDFVTRFAGWLADPKNLPNTLDYKV